VSNNFVLTRLHARYTKDSLGEDMVFKEAAAIAGGREFMGKGGKLEEGAVPYPMNNFQGRYAMRHPWTGPITCENPVRNVWGGPPSHVQSAMNGGTKTKAATNLAFVKRGGVELASFLQRDVPEIGIIGKGEKSTGVGPDPNAPKVPVGRSLGGPGSSIKAPSLRASNGEPNGGELAFYLVPFAFGLLSAAMMRGKKS